MIRFADPLYFLLLAGLPLAFVLMRHSGGRILFSNIKSIKQLASRPKIHPRFLLLVLRLLVLACVIVALARPQAGKTFTEVSSEGVDILLALDTSGSMRALDFKVHGQPVERLEVVKNVVTDFVKQRAHDRMGLVVFGDEAFLQCPLTLDHGILLDFLKEVEIGMVGNATAIGSAIGVAVNRIKDLKAKSKVIVLLTDGENTAGRITPGKAAEIAATFGVKIYTVGVGSKGRAPFLVNGLFGVDYQYRRVNLDEKTLKEIAQATGARYFRAKNTDELRQIYREIDQLEKTQTKVKEYAEYNELFHWVLLVAVLLLITEQLLGNTLLRKIP